MNLPNDLPNDSLKYKVRVSDRAKHVRLLISIEDGLEIIVPPNYDPRKIPDIVAQKQAWILRNQRKLNERQAFLQSQNPHDLPSHIHLRSLQESWQINYQSAVGFITIQETKGSPHLDSNNLAQHLLTLSGDISDITACRNLLKLWLKQKAEHHLTKWLWQVSLRLNLPYRTTVIRGQKTLWGSCSRDRNISLNYKLLFLEPDVVEYVLIHELCHTIHMNHSSKFWQLVQQHQANYQALDKSLNQAWRIIPAWLDIV